MFFIDGAVKLVCLWWGVVIGCKSLVCSFAEQKHVIAANYTDKMRGPLHTYPATDGRLDVKVCGLECTR